MGETSGQGDAASIQKAQSQHATDLFAIGSPGFRLALNDLIKDLGKPGEIPESVRKTFAAMRETTDKQFDQEEAASPMTVSQQMKQSGFRGGAGAQEYASGKVLQQLESGRRSSMNELKIQEVNQGLAQQQFDLQNIFGLVGTSMGQSNAFTANALGATGYNKQGGWGGVAGGALSGAAAGTAISPGWGTLAGALVGAAGSYFGSNP